MRFKTVLLCGVGFLLLGLGAVGVVLPVLPTTPFVLAAAGCFAATPKLHAWVMKIPFVREYLQNYYEKTGLRKRTVAISLIFLWGMLLISALHIRTFWIVGVLAAVGTAVTVHILIVARKRK